MKEPLISVVIPVWGKYKKYLPRCIKSVKEQTYKNIEIIVIDNETNAPKARNKGIAKAKGKYIAFLDADDIWFPDKIKKQVEAMEYLSSCPLCICWSEDNRFNTKKINKAPFYAEYKDILHAFNYSSSSTYMIRNNTGLVFNENLPSGQEYDFALRLLGYTQSYATCIPYIGVKQYSTEGQISCDWTKKIKGIYKLAQLWGHDYSIIDWLKVAGLLGLYFSGYFFGTKIYKIITIAKERYE